MAKVVEALNRPTLVLSHNKTLAAQLYQEFKRFFPKNRVEYFVSYYDYYQPEAYVPQSDTYIEKETQINEEIDKLRIAATAALFERRDVLIVASVSCIYGLGSPESFGKMAIEFEKGARYGLTWYLKRLVEAQYERTNLDLERGDVPRAGRRPRDPAVVRGHRASGSSSSATRSTQVSRFEIVTGKTLETIERFELFPKSHYVTPEEIRKRALGSIEAELVVRLEELKAQKKLLEAQRLEQRTRFDLEMMREIGYCAGIENYSRHLSGRKAGRAAADAPRLLPVRLPDDRRREPPDGPAAPRHVPRRPVPQGDARRVRLPAPLGSRQPAAEVRGVARARRASGSSSRRRPPPYELAETGGEVVEQVIRPDGPPRPAASRCGP